MTLEEKVIKKYYELCFAEIINDKDIPETVEYKSLIKIKNIPISGEKRDYIFKYLKAIDIKILWNFLSESIVYKESKMKIYKALIEYYKNKYPTMNEKEKTKIAEKIVKLDIKKYMISDLTLEDKIACNIKAFSSALKEINDYYQLFSNYVVVKESKSNIKTSIYNIDQNIYSIKAPIENIFSNDSRAIFYKIFFNLFQDLKQGPTYGSYSQAATTYFLKQLERQNKIKIISICKDNKMNLKGYHEVLGNIYPKECQMYSVQFVKIRDFEKNEIYEIQSLLESTRLPLKNWNFSIKNNKIYLTLNKELSKENLKKAKESFKVISRILEDYQQEYLDEFETKKEKNYIQMILKKNSNK